MKHVSQISCLAPHANSNGSTFIHKQQFSAKPTFLTPFCEMGYLYCSYMMNDMARMEDYEVMLYAVSNWSTAALPEEAEYIGVVENRNMKISSTNQDTNYGYNHENSSTKVNINLELNSMYFHIFAVSRRMIGEQLGNALGILNDDEPTQTPMF